MLESEPGTRRAGHQPAAPDIEAQRVFYDERWSNAGRANPWQMERAIAVLRGLRIANKSSPKILDLGCGTGWLASILDCFGPTTGVDLSPVAIRRARVCYPNVRFIAGDLLDVELPRQYFDIVVSLQVIDHMKDQTAFIEMVAGVLAPGGHLILVTNNARNVSRWTPGRFEIWAAGLQPIEQYLGPKDLRSMLRPHFRLRRLWTILPCFGDRGLFRILGSTKLARVLDRLGVLGVYQGALLHAGLGLVMVAVAERR